MSILLYLLFGGIVGWIASILMKTDGQQGIILNVVVGIVGSMLGTFLFNALGFAGVGGFSVYSFIVAVVGAVVLIWLVEMFMRTRDGRSIL